MLKLYNTESRQKEEVVAIEDRRIRLYTCGPTVYNFAHIGNFRTYVFEDLLRRSLRFFGFQVEQAMNLTDVDDKTIQGAVRENIPLKTFTDRYTHAFFEDLKALGIERAEHYPAATDHIPDMIQIIATLLEEGIAYKGADGSIYFAIDKFPSYGRLSHLCVEGLRSGASKRVGVDEYDKESAADFVLWKAYDAERDGSFFWESPFGRGRPGWHIECSAMAMKIFGPTVDIHVGGVDNMFPHHENEIAQSEAYSERRFVRYWLHVEHLLVDGKKMSKSAGNFYTLRDLIHRNYTGSQIRYLLLSTHYRTQLNFTFAGLDSAANTLERLGDFLDRLQAIEGEGMEDLIGPIIKEAEETFRSHLADDLNISAALASIFDLVRKVNTLCDQEKVGRLGALSALNFLRQVDQILGCLPFDQKTSIPQEFFHLLEQREEARRKRDWKVADACRDKLLENGYLIEDTPSGARLKKR